MRAVFIEKYGPPEVLVERSVEPPSPKPGEVRIQVEAAGVNFADLLQRLHLYGSAPKPPYIPGFEVSGRILERGEGVEEFREGDPVVAMTRFGGYAEEVCVPSTAARRVPEALTLLEAASIPVNFLSAAIPLFRMARLQPGERVLIHGAAGGVGSAAMQLASRRKAVVFGTAGGAEKVDFVKRLGADYAIDYREADFRDVIREATSGEGVDVVLDAVGGRTLRHSVEVLAPLGRVVSYGLSSAVSGKGQNWIKSILAVLRTPRFAPLDLIGRNIGVFGFHLALLEAKEAVARETFEEILHRFERRELETVVDRTFPLSREGAVAAHHYLHERRNRGKVLLQRLSGS